MDDSQADAIARAILEPDLKGQEELRRKRAAEERRMADQRLVAALALPAMAIGAVATHLIGIRFTNGIIWGGIIGAIVGWTLVWWRGRRFTP